MPLTDIKVRNIKPLNKAYKLSDEKGLFLKVIPNGSKYWRLKYRFAGKEKLLALGVYPEVSLADARNKRDEARKLVANNIDPSFVKQATKQTIKIAAENSFEAVAREWYIKFSASWVPAYSTKIIRSLEVHIFPWIGKRPIIDVTAPELLAALRRIESKGTLETAHRARRTCGNVFKYAIATGRAERDPSNDLVGAIPPPKTKHFPTITDPKAIGNLLRAIETYQGYIVTKYALKLSPLVFLRPGELRFAQWSELDFESAMWRIPGHRMKMKGDHFVPLATQTIQILKELFEYTGDGSYLFPGLRRANRPISDGTVNSALRILGYAQDEFTGHGFRSMASTLLNEQGWNRDAIERQLAHAERNSIRAAYNYAEYLPERREMMQHWADYLEKLKTNK